MKTINNASLCNKNGSPLKQVRTIKQLENRIFKIYELREIIHKKLLNIDLEMDKVVKELLNIIKAKLK